MPTFFQRQSLFSVTLIYLCLPCDSFLVQIDALRTLLKFSDQLELTKGDESGMTALHHSAQRDNEEAATLLVSQLTRPAPITVLCPSLWHYDAHTRKLYITENRVFISSLFRKTLTEKKSIATICWTLIFSPIVSSLILYIFFSKVQITTQLQNHPLSLSGNISSIEVNPNPSGFEEGGKANSLIETPLRVKRG